MSPYHSVILAENPLYALKFEMDFIRRCKTGTEPYFFFFLNLIKYLIHSYSVHV